MSPSREFVESIPEVYYRKAIDLNRFSNGVSRELLRSYERIIRRSIDELERIEAMPSAKRPKVRAQRLKALIRQNTEALARWSDKASQALAKELQGLARIEVEFAAKQLRQALPDFAQGAVRTVEVTPAFAEAVITADPTNIGSAILSDNLEEVVSGPGTAMKLTARQGAAIRMPDGRSIGKAFRGLAEKQSQMFATAVQDGLLTGESPKAIAKRLYGEGLSFSTQAKSTAQLAQSGGQLTKMAAHQVSTLVNTSMNATSNAASMRVYKANLRVSKRYRWLATLDRKTSPICRSLDQQVFEYGKGPSPENPPHFRCRSTTVPVVDYEGLSKRYGREIEPVRTGRRRRPSEQGAVPVGTSYGKWLYDLRPEGKKFEASAAQARAFAGGQDTPGGRQKARYFNRLASKYGPDEAMKKFLREDGTEVSLADLKKRYGEPERITATKTKAKPAATPKPKPAPPPAKVDANVQRSFIEGHTFGQKQKLTNADVADSLELIAADDSQVGKNFSRMLEFQRKNNISTVWSSGREKAFGKGPNFDHWKNDALISSMRQGAARGGRAARIVDDIANDLEKGQVSTFLNRIGKVGKGAGGHTAEGAGFVVLKQSSRDVKIKARELSRIKEAVKRSVEDAAAGSPKWLAARDLYGVTGKTTVAAKEGWLTTMVHEMGHQVHYLAGQPSLKGKWTPSKYGATNGMEQFAETFVQYVFAPADLKKANPAAFAWVEEALEAGLK